jgi:ferredoxin-nitrite reductase
MAHDKGFTGTQKQYLEGLASGLRLAQRAVRPPGLAGRGASADASQNGASDPGLPSGPGGDEPGRDEKSAPSHRAPRSTRLRSIEAALRSETELRTEVPGEEPPARPSTLTVPSRHRVTLATVDPAADGPLPFGSLPLSPDQAAWDAQDRFLRVGQRLSLEEKAKRKSPPEDLWPRMAELARAQRFPEAEEVFLFKYHGLFYVSPVEEAYMCRLRFAAGRVKSHQLRGLADLAERHGHPELQLTTRSNIQLRGIEAGSTIQVLTGLADLAIISRGSGGDGVRNVSASPTAGFDRRELIDTAVLARDAHHRVLFSRGLQALPRKFTLGFDGGGAVGAFSETCDLGFRAVNVPDGVGVPPGVYFRMLLGGATSHGRYARDAGVVVPPERCVDVLEQVLRVYIEHGDRTNRRRARLLYLLESWGTPRFVAELRARLERLESGRVDPSREMGALVPLSLDRCELPDAADPFGHVGFHNQKPRGKSYVGVVLGGGRLSVAQARGLCAIADQYGAGELRLTPYQNLLIPGILDTQIHRVKDALDKLSIAWSASVFRSGFLACTGSAGCQFAAADVKRRGEELVLHLESQFKFEQPLTIHVSGCHHACAQHTIADIGLLALRSRVGEATDESYQLWLGGQVANYPRFGREFASNVPAAELTRVVREVVETYFERRLPEETFRDFVGRVAPPDLRRWAAQRGTGLLRGGMTGGLHE